MSRVANSASSSTHWLPLQALLALALAGPVAAATIQVKVVDEDGAPVERPLVYLQRAGNDAALGDPFRRYRTAQADAGGNAQFDGLLTGHYVLGTRSTATLYVEGEDNPLAPRVQLTIDEPDQIVQVQLELHRGTLLCTRFVIDGSLLDAKGRVSRKELESAYVAEDSLDREEELCKPLFAGRWELQLQPPGGYLLVDLDVNGSSSGGNVALIDVRPGSRTQYVTWYLVAPARLEGKVHFEGDRFQVAIRAELLEGGEWLKQAEARGGSLYTPVLAYPDSQTHEYAMDLPDGLWKVQPVGEDLIEAEPSETEISIAKGENRRQNFTLRGDPSEWQPGLRVKVRSPAGDLISDAVVELWPPEPGQRGETPFASVRTNRWGRARIPDLEPGSYRLVAGNVSFREAARKIEFDPDDDKLRSQSIRLNQAAELTVRLVPDEENHAAGASIELTREDETLETELSDARLVQELRHPRAEIDATERAWVPGIYAGRYRVTGVHDRHLFEFKQGGRWVEEAELEFADGQSRELEARVVPAATVAGSLYCEGGEPMPTSAEVRVVPDGARPDDPLDPSWQTETVLNRDTQLGGEYRDAFQVGPLAPASYLVAVQPSTFDRWTWAFGTENGADAQSFQAKRGAQIELGAIKIDCAPALRVTVNVSSGGGTPDLSETRWTRDLQLRATVVTQDGQRRELERADLDRHRRLLMLRGFPEGDLRGEISLRHDHFVPDPWIRVPLDGEFLRGATIDVPVTVADIGGAIDLADPSRKAGAARLINSEGVERIEAFRDGGLSFLNLPVGIYRLQLCADLECGTMLDDPQTVEVEPLRTLELN